MIRPMLLALVVSMPSGCWPQVPPPVASEERSPAGVSYTLLHLPGYPYATIGIAWSTDWAYRADVNHAAAYVGPVLMLVGGADNHRAGEVDELFSDLNAEALLYGAATDHVIGEVSFELSDMDEVIRVTNAHLRAPAFGEDWLARLRDGLAADQRDAMQDAAARGFDAVRWAVFGAQPLRHALSPDPISAFEALQREDVVAWHGETFTRAPEAVVIVGGLPPEEAGPALDALLAGLPEAGRSPVRVVETDARPRRILLHVPGADVTTLTLLGVLPPTRLGGEIEDLLLLQALGSGNQSVLFSAVRTGLRASYSFGAGAINVTREHRLLVMQGEVDPARVADVERVVRDAYSAFRRSGPEDISQRKAALGASLEDLTNTSQDLAAVELQSALDGADVGWGLALQSALAAVTEESLSARLSDAWPKADDLIVLVVSADAGALPGACVVSEPRDAAGCPSWVYRADEAPW